MFNTYYYNVFNQPKFTDIWGEVESFITNYKGSGIKPTISDDSASLLYYLLYARYGNSTIASRDTEQFKYKVFSLIFMYGPTWEKRLEIQEKLRNLTEDEIRTSAQTLVNMAQNPEQINLNDPEGLLDFVSSQSQSKNKKGVLEGYMALDTILRTDVTAYFLDRFKDLFIKMTTSYNPTVYLTEEENE